MKRADCECVELHEAHGSEAKKCTGRISASTVMRMGGPSRNAKNWSFVMNYECREVTGSRPCISSSLLSDRNSAPLLFVQLSQRLSNQAATAKRIHRMYRVSV